MNTNFLDRILIALILILSVYTTSFSQGITTNIGFDVLAGVPIDQRTVINTLADTSTIDWAYEGLYTHVKDTDEYWRYTGGQWELFQTAGLNNFYISNDTLYAVSTDSTYSVFLPYALQLADSTTILRSLIDIAGSQYIDTLQLQGDTMLQISLFGDNQPLKELNLSSLSILVDSTRLIQDSILVYYQAGIEVGRDTITGTGGGGGSDNLGNHIMTQNLQTNGNWISGDGGNEGVLVDADGDIYASGLIDAQSVYARTSKAVRCASPDYTTSVSPTGAIEITLPSPIFGGGGSTLFDLSFTVNVKSVSFTSLIWSFKVNVHGTNAPALHSKSYVIGEGNYDYSGIEYRIGHDGANIKVWIGALTQSWIDIGAVEITDVELYRNSTVSSVADVCKGWSVTSESTAFNTVVYTGLVSPHYSNLLTKAANGATMQGVRKDYYFSNVTGSVEITITKTATMSGELNGLIYGNITANGSINSPIPFIIKASVNMTTLTWYNMDVFFPGGAPKNDRFNFRFGDDGTNFKIWIADLSHSWFGGHYVAITNVEFYDNAFNPSGFQAFFSGTNWSFSIESTSYNNVDVVVSPNTYASIPFSGDYKHYYSSNFVYDNSNTRLGIGNSTPSYTLDINSTNAVRLPVGTTAQRPIGATGLLRYNSDSTAFEGYYNAQWNKLIDFPSLSTSSVQAATNYWTKNGDEIYYSNSDTKYIGIGVNGLPNVKVRISGNEARGFEKQLYVQGYAQPGSEIKEYIGIHFDGAYTPTVNSGNKVVGGAFRTRLQGANRVGEVIGGEFSSAYAGTGTGTSGAQTVIGGVFLSEHAGTGNISRSISQLAGFKSTVTGGTLNNHYGVLVEPYGAFNGINIARYYGLYVDDHNTGTNTIDRMYGLYLENINRATDQNYAIYSAGGQSYHAGNFGIGNTTPTAKLHIAAGTATANTSPLKFTSGTNLITPEAGAVEWDGTNLYITQTTGPTRKQIAYTDDITAETNDLTSAVTWANVPDANITQSSVTQHQAALSITESQISDLAHTPNQIIETLSYDNTTGTLLASLSNDDVPASSVNIPNIGNSDLTLTGNRILNGGGNSFEITNTGGSQLIVGGGGITLFGGTGLEFSLLQFNQSPSLGILLSYDNLNTDDGGSFEVSNDRTLIAHQLDSDNDLYFALTDTTFNFIVDSTGSGGSVVGFGIKYGTPNPYDLLMDNVVDGSVVTEWVTIINPAGGQNGVQQSLDSLWANITAGGGASQLSDLSDVNTSTPTNRNVLVADGVDWESRALTEADISDLAHTGNGIFDIANDEATVPAGLNARLGGNYSMSTSGGNVFFIAKGASESVGIGSSSTSAGYNLSVSEIVSGTSGTVGDIAIGSSISPSATSSLTYNGLVSSPLISGSNNITGDITAAVFYPYNSSSGTISNLHGVKITPVTLSGTITNMKSLQIVPNRIVSGTVTNVTNIELGLNGSSFTNYSGLKVLNTSAATTAQAITLEMNSGANKYNIYASGSADNFFSGDVGIGVSSPDYKLDVTGTLGVTGTVRFEGYGQGNKEVGDLALTNSGYLATYATDGTLMEVGLTNPYGGESSITGILDSLYANQGGGGITSLNGLTGSTQTFAKGGNISAFDWNSSGSTHTLSVYSATVSSPGVVSTGTQTFSGAKTFDSDITRFLASALSPELMLKHDLATLWSTDEKTAFGLEDNEIGSITAQDFSGALHGGLKLKGSNRSTTATQIIGIQYEANVSNEPSTYAAHYFDVRKHGGSGTITDIGASSNLAMFTNDDTPVITIKGNGDLSSSGSITSTTNINVGANLILLSGSIVDENVSIGNTGEVLSKTATGVDWVDPSTLGPVFATYSSVGASNGITTGTPDTLKIFGGDFTYDYAIDASIADDTLLLKFNPGSLTEYPAGTMDPINDRVLMFDNSATGFKGKSLDVIDLQGGPVNTTTPANASTTDVNLESAKVGFYEQIIMSSITTGFTLTFSNPINGGTYVLHFRTVTGTDAVTFPSNVYWMDETAVGTVNITQGTKYTMYYDGTNYYME